VLEIRERDTFFTIGAFRSAWLLFRCSRSWSICFTSNSVITTRRQLSLARIRAAYMSFNTARSPNACGIVLVRRRSSETAAPVGSLCALHAVRHRQLQIRDASVEIVQEAGRGARTVALVLPDEVLFRHLRELGTASLTRSK
jgi:hypothetical protein